MPAKADRAPGAEDWERAILALLDERAETASICPSEVARSLGGKGWRAAMDAVRQAAARLVKRGALRVTQGPREVDVLSARGPVRLRRPA